MYRGLQIPEDALWEHRKCSEYTQKIPDWTPEQHFEFEVKRYSVERSWRASKRATFFSLAAFRHSQGASIHRRIGLVGGNACR